MLWLRFDRSLLSFFNVFAETHSISFTNFLLVVVNTFIFVGNAYFGGVVWCSCTYVRVYSSMCMNQTYLLVFPCSLHSDSICA